MSKYDEQEIERLRQNKNVLEDKLKNTSRMLVDAMWILAASQSIHNDIVNCDIWRRRKQTLEEQYEASRSN